MSAALRYLEEAKIEELAHEYESKGYKVAKGQHDENVTYDLIATNGQTIIAIEVKARADLSNHTGEIKRQREVARERGYNFQLFIVNPPREKRITFEGLNAILSRHFINHPPEELLALSARTTVDRVRRVEIDALSVTGAGFYVAGKGMVELSLEYGGGVAPGGVTLDASLPFDFAVAIDRQFAIVEVERLAFDTSGFDE